ncbi:hypothetical protein CL653_02510 [bacterium]|nr:hypothetical protein [bacterium]
MLLGKIKLEDDERIIKTTRQHWFNPVIKTCGTIFAILLPILVVLLITDKLNALSTTFALESYQAEIIFFYAWWLLIMWSHLAYVWTDHYLDLFVVTNKRIIKIDQTSYFSRSIGSFRLERLQDINIEINGLLATVLDFGDLEAQTASASQDEFLARRLPDPRSIKSAILEAADEALRRNPA